MTMSSLRDQFGAVWSLDTEFRCRPSERQEPVCLCARDLVSDYQIELFCDGPTDNPFDYSNSLFVGYHTAAEWKTFLSLGWQLPPQILDLHFEYLNYINGVWRGSQSLRMIGTGLVDAMLEFNLDGISHEEKDAERDYIINHTSYPPEGQRRILDYCWSDVHGTAQLLEAMLPTIDLDQALLRGSYSRAVAWMEHNGLPISPQYREIEARRGELQLAIAQEVEQRYSYGVYEFKGKKRLKPVFRQRNFDKLIRDMGLWNIWTKTPTGHCSTDDKKAFEPMAKLHPSLESLRQARKSVKSLGLVGTLVSADGRNRASVRPLGTVTGRNSPRTREFILNRPHWARFLIAPPEGRTIVHTDIVAAEAGIAGDASGDPEFIRIYNSGLDQYIEYAKSSGALPPDAVRDKANPHTEAIRSQYKVADLAIKYGIGPQTLAINLGIPFWQAERMIASHKRTYATYWAWAEAQIERAYQEGFISTSFGWRMAIDHHTSRNTILNFPQQAACAELLRLACILVEEGGMGNMLCAPHHDALYLECAEDEAEAAKDALESCFMAAAEAVLTGQVRLRLDSEIVRYPDHYTDEKGLDIWKIVQQRLAKLGENRTE